jgi:hypothetical protein
MDLFSVRLSKKTSEAGVWINDQEVADCMICHVRYTLLVRRHHCRRCGAVVCGRCSENRMFLESSRSGTLKRVCDTCFAASRKADEEEEEAEAAEEAATAAARAAMAKASLGGGGGRGAPAPAAAPAAAAAAAPRSSAPRVPEIPTEEAVAALKEHAFDGKWKSILTFTVVDNGGGKPEGEERGGEREGGPRLRAGLGAAVQALTTHDSSSFPLPTPLTLLAVPGLDIGSFKGSGAASASRKSTLTKDGRVRAGSRVELWLHLQPKGAAYFQGACANFGQFGAEGKVTGALQRSLGKVNMTVQMVNNKVTTSFNFVGMVRRRRRCRRFCRGLVWCAPLLPPPLSPSPTLPLPSPFPLPPRVQVNRDGIFQGTFSGCEISKNAGSVSGVFKAFRDDGGDEGDGTAKDAGEPTDDEGGAGAGAGGPAATSRSTKAKAAAASRKAKAESSGSDSD